ncbi:hypothetical protein ACFLWS_06320 [Chloroflexota bacterium]
MAIDYFRESEKYRPATIKTLLIGEAPPPSGKTYFYVPRAMSNATPIENDTSLPATIFNHYFHDRPTAIDRYIAYLTRLIEKGIFLIDICSDPIRVRANPEGVLRIIDEIPKLRSRVLARGIQVIDSNIVFLLARNKYEKQIRCEFPNSQLVRWKDFRMSPLPMDGT